jgi:Flp pilus assembly protein TadG
MERSERGFTTVFVALTLVVMLAACAFALDLGQAYTNRRQMQNAADTAAYAGTAALMKTRLTSTTFLDATNSVWTAVSATAASNGAAALALSQCRVIRRDLTEIANCSPSTGWTSDAITNPSGGGPAGVKVVTSVTENAIFGNVIGQATTTAQAKANALMRPLSSSRGSPFVICGKASAGGWDILASDNSIKPTAIYNSITGLPKWNLQESQAKDCGAGSTFKGKSFDSQTAMSIGDWVNVSNGNGNDHGIYDTVAGATPCPPAGPFTNCDLVVPIADAGRSVLQMHIVAFGVFHISGDGSGNPKYRGGLLAAAAPITSGVGGSGPCVFGAACVIKLAN